MQLNEDALEALRFEVRWVQRRLASLSDQAVRHAMLRIAGYCDLITAVRLPSPFDPAHDIDYVAESKEIPSGIPASTIPGHPGNVGGALDVGQRHA